MKKIIIFGMYNLSDGYKALSLELEKYYDISFFPLFIFYDRVKDQNLYNIDTIHKALNGEDIKMENYINKNNKKCDIIIVWHNYGFINNFNIEKINFNLLNFIKEIKNNYKIINLNIDPEINYKGDLPLLFDLNFVSDSSIRSRFKSCIFFSQGFNETMTYKTKKNNKYKCDVSCIITNLYENYGENRECSRKKILDKLVKSDLEVHIYGPVFLKDLYPNNYKCFISYDNIKYVLSNSLFSLNISPLNNNEYDNNYSHSERLSLIYACDSIMICNNRFDNFLPDNSYIHINNPDEIVDKINSIKNDSELYNLYIQNIEEVKYKLNYEYIVKNTFISNIDNL
jgi:hypothetical protein